MTLHLVPPGRGRWNVVTMVITGDRATPLFFQVGDLIPLNGRMFRVQKVLP